MKKIILIICICLCCKTLWAQRINADSLLNVVISRNSNAKVIPPGSLDSLIKAISLTKDPLVRSKLFVEINFGNADATAKKMVYAANRLWAIARKEKNLGGEAIAASMLGYNTYNSGDNAGGVKIMFNALKLAEANRDKATIGLIYNLLGNCTTNKSEEKRYYQKALQFSRAGGDEMTAGFELGNLGAFYADEHKPDSALYYTLKSLALAVKKNYEMLIGFDLQDMARLQSNPKIKLKYFTAALNMPNIRNTPEMMQMAAGNLASYYRDSKKIDSALYYARKAFDVSNKLLIGRRLWPSALLASLYKGQNADSALKYTEISYALRDSMYNLDKIEHAHAIALVEQQKQDEIAAQKNADQANLRLYVLIAVMICVLLLAFVFWRDSSQNKKAKIKIQSALNELKTTQQQLIQSEKMASLGELTAGIAHEIQNPLNFVNNFSDVNREMIDELKEELQKGDIEEAIAIANDIQQNEEKINHHGKRADSIVKGMLEHSRVGAGEKLLTNMNKLADEYLRLAYHGLSAKDKYFNAELITDFDDALPLVNAVQRDISRVLLNLFNNAFYAVNEKKKTAGDDYKPKVIVSTSATATEIEIRVKDNGNGIPDAIKDKIMQPFFTTKPTGEGTGLGLSLSYDIVTKGHGGKLNVETKEGDYAEFIVQLPNNNAE